MNVISGLIRRGMRACVCAPSLPTHLPSPLLPTTRGQKEEMAICKPGSGCSAQTLDPLLPWSGAPQPPELWGDKVLLFKPPSLWEFLMAAEMDQDMLISWPWGHGEDTGVLEVWGEGDCSAVEVSWEGRRGYHPSPRKDIKVLITEMEKGAWLKGRLVVCRWQQAPWGSRVLFSLVFQGVQQQWYNPSPTPDSGSYSTEHVQDRSGLYWRAPNFKHQKEEVGDCLWSLRKPLDFLFVLHLHSQPHPKILHAREGQPPLYQKWQWSLKNSQVPLHSSGLFTRVT